MEIEMQRKRFTKTALIAAILAFGATGPALAQQEGQQDKQQMQQMRQKMMQQMQNCMAQMQKQGMPMQKGQGEHMMDREKMRQQMMQKMQDCMMQDGMHGQGQGPSGQGGD